MFEVVAKIYFSNESLEPTFIFCRHLFGTNAYWECFIRAETGPENHQCGSVKMGSVKDPEAVVSSDLKVHGFSNIRVADASIFPENPNSNPVATIIMVAEKASELVTEAWT